LKTARIASASGLGDDEHPQSMVMHTTAGKRDNAMCAALGLYQLNEANGIRTRHHVATATNPMLL
jgi:hypothetical protein